METYKNFITEKLMIFGKSAYPKFGNVVILAGGAGSGKGYQLENLLGIEGKVLDVDFLKDLAIKSKIFAEKVKSETGYDIKNFNLKIPENVMKMHEILSSIYKIDSKQKETLFSGILTKADEFKPNLIFDTTLKDLSKLESISRNVSELGYQKRNIHIVWVINELDMAKKQNQERKRIVPDEILLSTHEGAALTMKKILDMGEQLEKYMDGVIYFSFNKVGEDIGTKKIDKKSKYTKKDVMYIEKANYIKIKEQGKPQVKSSELSQEIYDKIYKYVPKTETW